MTSLKYAVFLLVACIVSTGESTAESRECHTCNSVDNPGCNTDHFHPASPTNGYKICSESNQATLKAVQSHFFNHLHDFPAEKFNDIGDATKDTCVKFTMSSQHDHTKKVTFRGCSKLNENSCTIINTVALLVNTTVAHCSTCQDKNYCNEAAPFAASLLTAAAALVISLKF